MHQRNKNERQERDENNEVGYKTHLRHEWCFLSVSIADRRKQNVRCMAHNVLVVYMSVIYYLSLSEVKII